MLITSIFTLVFWIIIVIRIIICAVTQRKMIDFYYSDESGWDTHQQSIFDAYPQLDTFKMIFKFWVWPMSKFYPEYRKGKKNHEKHI